MVVQVLALHLSFDTSSVSRMLQPMVDWSVIGAHSTRTGIPNLGCSEEGSFIQCKTAQL